MATYTSSEAYDFSLFEPQVIEQPKRSQAPAKKTAKTTKRTNTTNNAAIKKKQNVLEAKGMTQTVERNSESVKLNKVAKRAMVAFVVCCVYFLGLLVMESRINELDRSIAQVENEIAIQEGEAVRLNAILSSKISSDKIESYAENVLGMVKAESYQISYIDLSDGDEIVVSGDKTVGGHDDLSSKIKQLFAYIF